MAGREVLRHAGELIKSMPEAAHVTQYYRTKPGSMSGSRLKCSTPVCRAEKDELITVIKYERDHAGKEWFDSFCNSCAPAMFRVMTGR